MKEKQHPYLESILPSDERFQPMEAYAEEHHVPIMDKVSVQFLCQLAMIQQPQKILEIGTAIGYSAIKLADTLPVAHIITLERDEGMIELAEQNIAAWKLNDRIKILAGEAADSLRELKDKESSFDLIFIDAAKAQYESFFKAAESLLSETGVIVCDNVLFRGYVANSDRASSPRLKKLAQKIDGFNRWLSGNEMYHTSIVPVGDGISISKKRV